jgi:hypothetical protein
MLSKQLEEGRRQRAEGRRNFFVGDSDPANCKRGVDGGVLDPSSVRSQPVKFKNKKARFHVGFQI